MSEVVLRNVTKRYGSFLAVDNLSLTVREGEFLTLLGASGSGKTTCLRMVAGFVSPDQGQVLLGGVDATAMPPYRRNTGMVFQSYALFPHLTVAANIAYGLKVRRVARAEIAERTAEALRLVHLEGLAERYPAQLSGGQKQRVALARAVVVRPAVLLLDEPLSALDLKLRGELQSEIRRVQQLMGITALFVTHDQGEALGMSDRVAVMRHGRILQVDTPVALYQRPASRYVASFVGTTNFIETVVRGPAPDAAGGAGGYVVALAADPTQHFEVAAATGEAFAAGEPCLLCLRPENGAIDNPARGTPSRNRIDATLSKVTFVGERWIAECRLPGGTPLIVTLPGAEPIPALGERITVGWAAEHCVLLKAEAADAA